MVQNTILRRRSWAGMAWLVVIAGLLAALALGNTLVMLSTFAVAAVVGWLLLCGLAIAPASSPVVAVGAARAPRAQRTITAADGVARQALVVPAAAVDGYQAVLTIDGYALVNAEGRAVYALNRYSHTGASESDPVVVTIFDAEVSAQ